MIVLLYIGLITSFCLNVSLLLKSYSEPSSAEISIAQHQLGLDEADLSRGKYISIKGEIEGAILFVMVRDIKG